MKLKSFNGLTQQMFEKPFKTMFFQNINDIWDEFRISIICDRRDNKYYIENELQNGEIIVGVLLIDSKKGKIPVIIKPKSVDIITIFK